MKPYLTDVPVLLIFFCRDEQFRQVFEQVKIARPSKLFLYQDGPRPDVPTDAEGIKKCREIAEDIDWECEVFKYYQEENIGCDPSCYIAQRWAFDNVDRCIVLEDDCVPCQSFFTFCYELLERYKDDERINSICGMNQLNIVDNPYDYFFSGIGCIWGWASWKRVINTWDSKYSFLNNSEALKLIRNKRYSTLGYSENLINFCKKCSNTGKAYHEAINNSAAELNSRIFIIPSKNMISNIGISADSTHNVDTIKKLPRATRKLFFSQTYELDFPVKHPEYIICDRAFDNAVFKLLAIDNRLSKLLRFVELFILSLRYNDLKTTYKKIRKHI